MSASPDYLATSPKSAAPKAKGGFLGGLGGLASSLGSVLPLSPFSSGAGLGGVPPVAADQREFKASLKSDNKNKLAANVDLSGAAGQRGAVFNFGQQATATVGAGGGALTWIVVAIIAVVAVAAIFIWRKK